MTPSGWTLSGRSLRVLISSARYHKAGTSRDVPAAHRTATNTAPAGFSLPPRTVRWGCRPRFVPPSRRSCSILRIGRTTARSGWAPGDEPTSPKAEPQPLQVGFDGDGREHAQEEEHRRPEAELATFEPAPRPMDGKHEVPEPAEGGGTRGRGVTVRGHPHEIARPRGGAESLTLESFPTPPAPAPPPLRSRKPRQGQALSCLPPPRSAEGLGLDRSSGTRTVFAPLRLCRAFRSLFPVWAGCPGGV